MREIKFKVWDKDDKKFLYWSSKYVDCSLSYVVDHPGYIVTQYTGLKDRDGKEIYEGDILEGYNAYDYEDCLAVCKYNAQGTFYAFYDFEMPSNPKRWGFKNGRIVGNIYENPELIKEK